MGGGKAKKEARRRHKEEMRKARLRRKEKAARMGREGSAERLEDRPVEEPEQEEATPSTKPTLNPRTIDIYTDGSSLCQERKFGGCGFAFLDQESGRFRGCAISLGPETPSARAEQWGVRLALQHARQKLIGDVDIVRLHIDCQGTLEIVGRILRVVQSGVREGLLEIFPPRALRRNGWRTETMEEAAREIWDLRRAGVMTEAHWIKGHSGDQGNDCADKLARLGANASRDQEKGLGEWVEWKDF